ncbi:hypothetical protein D3C86_2057360 [compost metagenome]
MAALARYVLVRHVQVIAFAEVGPGQHVRDSPGIRIVFDRIGDFGKPLHFVVSGCFHPCSAVAVLR